MGTDLSSNGPALLLDIAHCPVVDQCLASSNLQHPCATIVQSQLGSNASEFYLPEPWSGDIVNAPILFLSSNPGIDSAEEYPQGAWAEDEIVDFFTHRFGGGRQVWVKDGLYGRRRDGTHAQGWVRFWAAVRSRATELLGRAATPGVDYALSEVVHCKSNAEQGVVSAVTECAPRWLRSVVETAGARVIICLGGIAGDAVRSVFSITSGDRPIEQLLIAGRSRAVVFLPHPNARIPRKIAACISEREIAELRSLLVNASRA